MNAEAPPKRPRAELEAENEALSELSAELLARLGLADKALADQRRSAGERASQLKRRGEALATVCLGAGLIYGAILAGRPFEH